jgi:hypothetical protein
VDAFSQHMMQISLANQNQVKAANASLQTAMQTNGFQKGVQYAGATFHGTKPLTQGGTGSSTGPNRMNQTNYASSTMS